MGAFWEQGGRTPGPRRAGVRCLRRRAYPPLAGYGRRKLLVAEGGGLHRTIGGGMMEHRLREQAGELLRRGGAQPEKRTLVHSDSATGERSRMVCKGSQTNVFCMLATSHDRDTVRAHRGCGARGSARLDDA